MDYDIDTDDLAKEILRERQALEKGTVTMEKSKEEIPTHAYYCVVCERAHQIWESWHWRHYILPEVRKAVQEAEKTGKP